MPFVSSVRGSYGLSKRPFPNFNITSSNSAITGGSITVAGGYRIHTFTTVGNDNFVVTPNESRNGTTINFPVEYLVIAGGGGGGAEIGGGGGAGGYRTGTIQATIGNNAVTVGGGGAGGTGPHGNPSTNQGFSGANSVFASITSTGGGGGGSYFGSEQPGKPGGSGGGGGGHVGGAGGGAGSAGQNGRFGPNPGLSNTAPGGSATPGQGNNGGTGHQGGHNDSGGSAGGNGLSSSITGSAVTRAGGGGGSWYTGAGSPQGPGSGGAGGGGPSVQNAAGTPGTANTGSGGGSTTYPGPVPPGGSGGPGIVIVRYPV